MKTWHGGRARDLAEEVAEVAGEPEKVEVCQVGAVVAAGEEGGAGAGSASCGSDHSKDCVEAGGGGSVVLGAQGEACGERKRGLGHVGFSVMLHVN